MVLTYDEYNETLENEKQKEDRLTFMEKQHNSMQSQFQILISTLGNTQMNENEKNSMARNLYDSGLIKSTTVTAEGENTVKVATTSSSSSTDPRLLIKAAAKAAYHVTKSKSTLSREATSVKTKVIYSKA